ncbi:MAG: Alkaline phosphatase [Myxococcaceae bacterium]|nr:Alkaline phosphatase [Myxococcaceae bacterium]
MTKNSIILAIAVAGAAMGAGSFLGGCRAEVNQAKATPKAPEWQLLASELPSALLSVSARSPSDVFAVGADKGHGPLVLHFDGKGWKELHTGVTGDLWWVQAIPNGPVLMSGASGMVLRYDGQKFERLPTPGLGKHTVYGVWGRDGSDFYAVGSAGGRNGFVWHYRGGKFEDEALPLDLPRVVGGEVPGFFKVWGRLDEVWVVGAGGAIMHRRGSSPFVVVPSPSKDTLFTVSGAENRLVAVGGSGNGVVLTTVKGVFGNASPPGAGLIQGVFVGDHGDWASGERGLVYTRAVPTAPFTVVDTGLTMPPASSLHSIFVDASGGVWSAGGNVLTPALDNGMLVHYGEHVSTVVIDEEEKKDASAAEARGDGGPAPGIACPADVVAAGKSASVARRFNEQILWAIRRDLPRPTVHARNLFHMSAAMWDAWAGYDTKAKGVFVDERHTDADLEKARRTAIAYAAQAVLAHRYKPAVGGAVTLACLRAVMADLGYDANDTHDTGDDPIAFGNRVAHTIIAQGAKDGANEAEDYKDSSYEIVNPPLVYDGPGTTMKSPAVWQPINLSVAATQNGIILPAGVQGYIGAGWGGVTPFAMKRAGNLAKWPDPGPVPKLGAPMKEWVVEVIRKTASFDPADPTTMDISPGVFGHNALGANDGKGWTKNPVTGTPYPPQVVRRGDFARVMAEFWADGPKSETPPGHWNTLANAVSDTPGFERKLFGKGASLDPLSWDVHVYLALNGAEHDAAIAAWGIKRQTATVRPLSLVRWMGGKGQSSDPKGPSYDPDGLPIVPGLIEVITKESSAPGERHAHLGFFVGQIAVRDWLGEPGDRAHQVAGVGWVRAVDWITYQRRTFVTPAFPAFISGHSTFSRAGAEVLASLTGSPYFPGGMAEFVAPKDTFLTFEKGPSTEVRLQWASYFDASDQAGQSRLWGSIHIAPDDFAGRRVGHQIGIDALALAMKYFSVGATGL